MHFKLKCLTLQNINLIKLIYKLNRTALHLAVEKENIEIIKLLLNNNKLDIDIFCICALNFFYEIQNQNF